MPDAEEHRDHRAAAGAHAAAPVHRRQSVLIVDDSELNRKMLGQMLGSRFDIAEAASGEACLQLLEQNATGISIVLLDIHMPGIDGFTVLEEMNQKNLLEQIPVIMISSEDTVDAVRRAFDLGARITSAARSTPRWSISASSTTTHAAMTSQAAARR